MLGIGYVNVPGRMVERNTYDICSSVLFEGSTPERNITAENWDDWIKL